MIQLDDHSDAVRLGAVHYHEPFYNWGRNVSTDIVAQTNDLYVYDPLIADLLKLEFRSPELLPIRQNFGYSDASPESGSYSILGFPPGQYDLPSKLPRLATLDKLNRFFSGSSTDLGVTNEHTVAHVNLQGKVSIGAVESPRPGGPNGDFLTAASISPGTAQGYALSVPVPLGSGVLPSVPTRDQVGLIQAKLAQGLYDQVIAMPNINVGVKNLRFHYRNDQLESVTYVLWQGAFGGPGDGITDYLWYKELKIGLGFYWLIWETQPTASSYLHYRYLPIGVKLVHCVKQYTRALNELPSWHVSPRSLGSDPMYWPSDLTTPMSGFWAWSCSSPPQRGWEGYSGISGVNGCTRVDTGPTSFLAFRREVVNRADDFLVMGFLAQSDAYDANFKVMKSSLLEFFFELSDVFDLVANPLELLEKVASLRKLDLREPSQIATAIKSLLDLVSDATLYYSFMLSPTVSLAEEIAAKAGKLSQSFDLFFGYQTINGKAVYTIGDEIPYFSGCTVIGRSKMRVRIPPDSALAAVLPLDRVRLLPSLSNYWETVTGSFIVDWFFNVQSKLDVIDKTVTFLAMDVGNCVNSATVYKPIVPIDFMVGDFEETAYKYYARWILSRPQVFTPTALNVLGAKGVPSWLTAGSLLYKLT